MSRITKHHGRIDRDNLPELLDQAVHDSGMSNDQFGKLVDKSGSHIARLRAGTSSSNAIPEILRAVGWEVTETVTYRPARSYPEPIVEGDDALSDAESVKEEATDSPALIDVERVEGSWQGDEDGPTESPDWAAREDAQENEEVTT